MQSKLGPGRFRRPAEAQRSDDRALDAGLLIYACIYCTIVGCAAVGLYELLQPTRYPNPGVSANTLPSRSTPVFTSPIEQQVKSEDEQEAKGENEVAQQPSKTQDLDHATAGEGPRRTHPVRAKRRNPTTEHGAQPAFGSYRPWGDYQAWGNYRAWR